MKKYFNVCVNIALWILIIVASCVTIVSLNTKKHGISNVGGIVIVTVEDDEMSPTIRKNDLLLAHQFKEDTKIEKGDIITYLTFKDNKTVLETHRIDKVIIDGGLISYETKGDNNLLNDEKILMPNEVVAVYKGFKIPFAGKLLEILKSKTVFFLFVLFPLILTIAYFTYDLFSKDKQELAIKD